VTPPDGKVTGTDGRRQPATKPKIIPQLEELIDAGKVSPKLKPDIEALDRNQQGVVLELVRAGTNPRKAIAEALGPGREPGVEPPARRAARNGQPAFDVKEFKKLLGHVYAQVHKVRTTYGLKEPGESEELERDLTKWGGRFEAWVRQVAAAAGGKARVKE
jgi:hypothetical protein